MTTGTSPKKQIFTHFAQIAKAMASPNRLELLEALAQGERSVEKLATATGMPIANTSHHLQVLREGGLVRSRKEGVQVIYSLSDDEVPQMLGCLRRVGERHLAEVELIVREHFASDEGLRPVNHQELTALLKSGEALIIDVRPPGEYEAGHIPGAVNVPIEALPRRLSEFPRRKEVVAYCRGPYCMLAVEAVKRLRKRGYRARRLEDGFPEWKAEGRPVAVGK
ncbi:MAG: ArsR family transcriptional regulator [Candidatus Muproteobacteria bacterium RBG_16_64_10]|uniref:ArsR family transcriptional regulator n=1 Tax=Candidatus Muproteobacteria bacterium RBG_16_64_10 TaxID=1817757 RepID=A0A1F6T6K8_9PROT|nr:MAG: ArsR family transcriptional regulator [Candidatus Muproteobacteria bacterium RBG_16_64_10]